MTDLNPYPKGHIDRDAWQDGFEGREYDEKTFGRVGDPEGSFDSYGAFRNGERFRKETRLMSEAQKASHMKENMSRVKFNNELNFKTNEYINPIGPVLALEATLMDMFAAKAMAAMVSAYPCQSVDEADGGCPIDPDRAAAIASDSYELAQAMMTERRSRIA